MALALTALQARVLDDADRDGLVVCTGGDPELAAIESLVALGLVEEGVYYDWKLTEAGKAERTERRAAVREVTDPWRLLSELLS